MASLAKTPTVVRRLPTISPTGFRRVAYVALAALAAIVMTGAAVRLTGSGLGCPNWPKCYGSATPPLQYHALIEFGNRMVGVVVGVVTIGALVLATRRRPFRRDLVVLSALLPLGVICQAVLGGLTVKGELDYGWVMGHFALSMVILIAAVALAWRAGHVPGERLRASDRASVWTVRALLPLAALTIFVGTAATAAGPHAGGAPGEHINRLNVEGAATLNWVIHRHAVIAAVFGLAVVGTWLLLRDRGADPRARRAVTYLAVLVGAQGVIGGAQYDLHLPSGMVWIHVGLATLTWLAALWAVAAAGRLAPRAVAAGSPERAQLDTAAASATSTR